MAVSCTPTDLISASSQFCCITGETAQAVKLYLLRHIAGLDALTPQQLLAASACWMTCVPSGAYKAVEAYLLCQIANSGGTPTVCAPQEGADSPVGAATPDFIGQLYHETGDDTYWRSTGLTNADWVEISGVVAAAGITWSPDADEAATLHFGNMLPSGATQVTVHEVVTMNGVVTINTTLETVSFPLLESVGGITGSEGAVLIELDLPLLNNIDNEFQAEGESSLTTIDLGSLETVGSNFSLNGAGFASIGLPVLISVGGNLILGSCALLAGLSLPSLTTIGGNLQVNGCGLLVTFSAPNWVPTDGTTISFVGDALDVTSVDLILHRCFLAGLTTATIDLSGGTNATPSVAGLADKATLIGNGCTVTTN